jgi:hypothetical protein
VIYPRLVFAHCRVSDDPRLQRGSKGEIERIAVTIDWGEGRVASIADGPLAERIFLAALAPSSIAAVFAFGPNRAHLVALFSREEYAKLRAGQIERVAPFARWLWEETHRLAGTMRVELRVDDDGSVGTPI